MNQRTNSYTKKDVAILGATLTARSLSVYKIKDFVDAKRTQVWPEPSIQPSHTLRLYYTSQGVKCTSVLDAPTLHPSNLHLPPQHIKWVCQGLRYRTYTPSRPSAALIKPNSLTSQSATRQFTRHTALARWCDYASQELVRRKVDTNVGRHTNSGSDQAPIQGTKPAFFTHNFEGHAPHCQILLCVGNSLGCCCSDS